MLPDVIDNAKTAAEITQLLHENIKRFKQTYRLMMRNLT